MGKTYSWDSRKMYGRILVKGEEPTIGPVYYTKYMDHGTYLLKGGTKLIYLKSNLEEKQVRGMGDVIT